MEKESKHEILRSFSNIKNVDTKIYRVGNIDLWTPIAIETASIFIVSAFLVFKTAKIDGKKPHIYLLRLIDYKFNNKKVIERFEFREEEKEFEFE